MQKENRPKTNIKTQAHTAPAVQKPAAVPHTANILKRSVTAKKNIRTPQNTEPRHNLKRPSKKQRAEQRIKSRQVLNARIKTQTPSNRTAQRKDKRINGSIKNLEIKRRVNTGNQKFRVKKKKNPMRRIIILGLIIFFLIFMLLFGLLSLWVSSSLDSDYDAYGEAYRLQVGMEAEDDESNIVELSSNVAERNGILYVPVSALADMCELTVTGMSDDLRYIVRDSDDQTIRFIVDTDLAYVNTCKVRLSAETFIDNAKLYVPLDFFTQYSSGITINVDKEENLITIYRNVVGKDEYLRDIYADFEFKMAKLEALPTIPVPLDIEPDQQTQDNN